MLFIAGLAVCLGAYRTPPPLAVLATLFVGSVARRAASILDSRRVDGLLLIDCSGLGES